MASHGLGVDVLPPLDGQCVRSGVCVVLAGSVRRPPAAAMVENGIANGIRMPSGESRGCGEDSAIDETSGNIMRAAR
jgi:hypothetical protein